MPVAADHIVGSVEEVGVAEELNIAKGLDAVDVVGGRRGEVGLCVGIN